MAIPTPHCKPKQLKRLLAGSLAEQVESHIAAHLDECDTCRLQLETLAAQGTWWTEASQFLADDDPERVFVDESPTTGETIQLGALADEIETTPDELVLDLLDKSEQPGALGRLGEYDLLEVIGRGGMGIVFKAYDRALNRHLAIKILAPHFASSGAARKRFAREARAAAAVVHQHVVAIHAVEATGKLPYLVMPYVACESLQERIDRDGALPLADILRIGAEVAGGLAAAHDQGLVHRDAKPANILLEEQTERVLLTDFGLARAIDDAALTRSGIIAGTPQYMSPEQAKGESIDHRTDLFSLGSVLYAMCTGHPPFRAETTMGVLRRICDGTSIPLRDSNASIPSWLIAIIDKLLEKAPQDRYESAGEVAALLEDCLAHVQHPTSAPLPASLQPTNASRHRRRLAIGGTLGALSLMLMLFFAWQLAQRQEGPERETEDAAARSLTVANEGATPLPAEGELNGSTQNSSLGRHAERSPSLSDDPETIWFDGLESDFYQNESDLLLLEATDF